MLHLMRDIGFRALEALKALVGDHPSLLAPLPVLCSSRPEFGDLQISACLQLAKPLQRSPQDLAKCVMHSLESHSAIEKTELAGPGYVNVHLKSTWLADQVIEWSTDTNRGADRAFSGQSAVVDFSSPNVAKPMHVGHIRSTILGDAIRNILKAVGYRVIADNHIGDWGTQFGKLIVAYRRWLDPIAYAQAPLEELVRLYQKFVTEEKSEAEQLGMQRHGTTDESQMDTDESSPAVRTTTLLREARLELLKLQKQDPENIQLWQEFVRISLENFQHHYDRLGIAFDTMHGESFYHSALAGLVARLTEQGIAVQSEGAVVCPVEGEPVPLLIQKADGAYLYGTTDLATIEYRWNAYQAGRILYIVGAPQQLHFRQVFAVAKKMGIPCQFEHISFGSIRFFDPSSKKWIMGGTRKGNAPLLDALLEEAIQRAEVVVRKKNPDLSEPEYQQIAQQVGIGAIKYNFLNRDRNLDINFDLEQALSLDGNTAPYIQYAYARIRSIQRNAQWTGSAVVSFGLYSQTERTLAKKLLEFCVILDQAVRTVRIHLLTEYLYDLAVATNQFYQEVHVMRSQPLEKASRLRLLDEVAQTLRYGLSLLGISCPEKM